MCGSWRLRGFRASYTADEWRIRFLREERIRYYHGPAEAAMAFDPRGQLSAPGVPERAGGAYELSCHETTVRVPARGVLLAAGVRAFVPVVLRGEALLPLRTPRASTLKQAGEDRSRRNA